MALELNARSIANASRAGQRGKRPVRKSCGPRAAGTMIARTRPQQRRRKRGSGAMSFDRRLNQLNGATRECLERCYRSADWLTTLALYAEQLRGDGWSEADIEEVEARVRKILRAIAESARPMR